MMAPGALLSILFEQLSAASQIQILTGAFLKTSAISSANCTMNEFLNKDFDRHHLAKQKRALVWQDVSSKVIAFRLGLQIIKLIVFIRRWSARWYQSTWLLERSKPRHNVIRKKLKRSCYFSSCSLLQFVFGTCWVRSYSGFTTKFFISFGSVSRSNSCSGSILQDLYLNLPARSDTRGRKDKC